MSKTILILVALAIGMVCQDSIVFESNSQSLKLNGDWLEKTSDLEKYREAFEKGLEQELREISLSFAYCQDPKYILETFLSKKMKASTIKIYLDGCKIGDHGVSTALEAISQKVTHLELKLDSVILNQQTTSKIGKKLSELPLRVLKLTLLKSINGAALHSLLSHALNSEIESIELDLSMNKLTPKNLINLQQFLSKAQPQRLKHVTINLSTNKLQEQGAVVLSKALHRFINLETLRLDLYFNNLKIKGAQAISHLIQPLSQLKRLSINFDLNYIETEGGEALGKAIIGKQHLIELQIGVSRKNFGYNGFVKIVQSAQHLQNLKSLTFRCGVNRVGYKGAEKLANLIKSLQNLQVLNIEFVENFISDDGIKIISEAISQSLSLKQIKLNLGFNEARSYGIVEVIKTLDKLNVPKISLGLSNNPIADSEIKLMVPAIRSILSKCQSFEFEFLQTNISEELMEILRNLFEKKGQSKCVGNIYINSKLGMNNARANLQKIHKEDHGMLDL